MEIAHSHLEAARPGRSRGASRAGRVAARTARRSLAAATALLLAGCSVWPFRGAPDGDPTVAGRPGKDGAAAAHVAARGALPAALAELRAQQAAQPGDPTWPYRMGAVYAAADSAAPAERALRAALALDPSYAPALSLLSAQLFVQARHQEAVDLLEAARQRGAADLPELRAGLALHYEALGDHEQARRLADALAGPGAHWRTTGAALAYIALRSDDLSAAADPARQALSADPELAANHNNYGIVQLCAGDPRGARASFLKALELDPQLAGAYYNLAIVDGFYFFDEEAARGWLDRYWALSHDDPDNLRTALAAPQEGRPVALEAK